MLKSKYYILLIVLVFFGSYVFLESTSQAPLDWTDSYWKTHSKPFGAEVFHQIFTKPLEQTQETQQSTYETLTETYKTGNYLFFNGSLGLGKYDTQELLCWIDNGNTVMMSAEYLPKTILDTLNLKKEKFVFDKQFTYQPSVTLDTTNQGEVFDFKKNLNVHYFTNTDTLKHQVLGYSKVVNDDSTATKYLPNFIKADLGRGELYLHLFPKAFTNYFLVNDKNAIYTEQVLSGLNYDQSILVDEYYKAQRVLQKPHLLQYLVADKHLRWAYYLLLLLAVIYIVFEGKRKQKPIKVLQPYENKTYAFTKTIAEMYYRKKDHKSIATKQIEHFYDFVRSQYNISTTHLDDDFVTQLASKSGKAPQEIKSLLKYIKNIESQKSISKEQLLKLEKQLSNLKN
ncbi:MAG: hypothetical protein GVY05_10535 [Bacteroidetes bacterium]|jgi:hypothetical protein|nr:hypothetical protein [Bacteroidota bacterium]